MTKNSSSKRLCLPGPFPQWVALLLVTLFPVSALSLDTSRLWLPKKYRSYYPKLLLSAEMAEAQESCTAVLEGTLDLEQSAPEQPVFRILCRSASGSSFNVMIDGNTRRPLSLAATVDSILTYEQKLERQRLAEEKARRQERLAREAAEAKALRHQQELWEVCEQQFQERTANLLSVKWLAPWPVEPLQIDEQGAVFVVEFDALDPVGTPLQFQATCSVQTGESGETVIEVRR